MSLCGRCSITTSQYTIQHLKLAWRGHNTFGYFIFLFQGDPMSKERNASMTLGDEPTGCRPCAQLCQNRGTPIMSDIFRQSPSIYILTLYCVVSMKNVGASHIFICLRGLCQSQIAYSSSLSRVSKNTRF